MTNEMRERVETAVNTSKGNLTIEFAKEAIEMKKRQWIGYNKLDRFFKVM